MTEDSVLLLKEETADGAIALVTLNRPDVRNAIDLRMVQDLGKVLDAITLDDAIRAVVIEISTATRRSRRAPTSRSSRSAASPTR